ncbi:uncharacterized protein METZ01_LOCUS74108 [marine metagenome]|uniref:Uncharacterized protein n=1 Tax=marine metagenome TaxID=408172 RepID=A0A381TZL5_9ZZZZ
MPDVQDPGNAATCEGQHHVRDEDRVYWDHNQASQLEVYLYLSILLIFV